MSKIGAVQRLLRLLMILSQLPHRYGVTAPKKKQQAEKKWQTINAAILCSAVGSNKLVLLLPLSQYFNGESSVSRQPSTNWHC